MHARLRDGANDPTSLLSEVVMKSSRALAGGCYCRVLQLPNLKSESVVSKLSLQSFA